ncbi:hypothetical protein FE257_012967 [Aspergillus nanangensis]|uniref:Uncharacterized protein n=1 Tax=Aspergillus nanangensis TaxID=2582783 RepID=A0AAD4CF35_ASPNN|nr:hypothetical protein FE257_012967 [Aspergillus nanangensis]
MPGPIALLARECDPDAPNSAGCEKPVSNFLKSGVPGIVVGVLVFIAICVCSYFLYRNKKRDAQEARADRAWNN